MNNGQFKKGQPSWNAGTHLSGMLGKHHTEQSKAQIGQGNKKANPKTPFNERERRTAQYFKWRSAVFEKDSFTCQRCGVKKEEGGTLSLHAHHVKSFFKNPELRFAVENGETLCETCHGKIHNIFFPGYQIKLVCPICGKEFKPKDGHFWQKTCSKKCGYLYISQKGSSKKGRHYPHLQRARVAKCEECGKEFRAVKDTTKRQQKFCSRECYLKHRWPESHQVDGVS